MRGVFRIVVLFFVVDVLTLSIRAQDNRPATSTIPPITLTTAQWQAIEGYYQSTSNTNLYIQTMRHDSLLIVKFLWMPDVDTLRPLSELAFISANEGGKSRLTFVKNAGGAPASVEYVGYTWNKINDYKPVAVKVMRHTPAQLQRFTGVYHSQRDSNNLIQIVVEGDDLVLKETRDTRIVPQTELSFYKPDNLWFSVDFSEDANGNITKALVVKRDVWLKNPKPAITAAQLHSYEGRYRAKNDSDNIIQLIAKDSQLVVKQLWDGKEILVTPLADLYFYNKANAYPLQFVRDADGKVRQAWLFNTTEFDRKVEK